MQCWIELQEPRPDFVMYHLAYKTDYQRCGGSISEYARLMHVWRSEAEEYLESLKRLKRIAAKENLLIDELSAEFGLCSDCGQTCATAICEGCIEERRRVQ